MQIRLNNIGIIKDSAILLNGLTVITGKNNSGKTTVGKSLYAILDAVENIQAKARRDKILYIRQQIDKVRELMDPYIYVSYYDYDDGINILSEKYPAMAGAFTESYEADITTFPEYERFAHDLYNEIQEFEIPIESQNDEPGSKYSEAAKMFNDTDVTNQILGADDETVFTEYNIAAEYNAEKQQAIEILDKLFVELKKDPELIEYTRASINQTLRTEFSGQIQPARESDCLSAIALEDVNSKYIQLNIQNNNILKNAEYICFAPPFKKVYFIDDPFVLDGRTNRRDVIDIGKFNETAVISRRRVISHSRKLESVLHRPNNRTVFEENILSDELKNVKRQIDEILPGTFEFSPRESFYVDKGVKLKISNLATGTKMFSIIKILLENGRLEENTMLILDEPEAHLHPMWQNAFAEIIVLLIKELGVNVLLTTHSPNFMLALDAYMRKYEICEKTNFYQTEELDNGFVHYECVNDDLGKIYQDFLTYLSDMKMLRNKYLYNEEEE